MARLDKGLLGGYTGKLGTTVGSTWKGINVVRTYQPNVANPNTQKQSDHRSLFSEIVTVGSFLLSSHVKPLWDRKAKGMSGYNAFMRANINAMKDQKFFDGEKFVLSEGRIGPSLARANPIQDDGKVLIGWGHASDPLYGSPNDEVFFVAFNYAGEVISIQSEPALRKDKLLEFYTIEGEDLTEAIVCIAFKSPDGNFQSMTERFTVTKA